MVKIVNQELFKLLELDVVISVIFIFLMVLTRFHDYTKNINLPTTLTTFVSAQIFYFTFHGLCVFVIQTPRDVRCAHQF